MTRTELINYYNNNKNKIIVITLRNGHKYIMLNSSLFVNEWTTFGLTSNEDLTSTIHEDHDIMEIKSVSAGRGLSYALNSLHSPLIWKRSETIELTLDEIASKFNIPVNQLKIKK